MKLTKSIAGKYRMQEAERGHPMTPEEVDAYIADMKERGRVRGTIGEYRRTLGMLYDFLPEDKYIRKQSLPGWREALLEQGYNPRTVNARLSAANSYLAFCGRRDLQLMRQLETEAYTQPELTRNEYLRLLQTARLLGKERLYLLIKLYGSTGLPVKSLERVTVEAVRNSVIQTGERGKNRIIRIPGCLRSELLEYAGRMGRKTGSIFVTKAGKPLSHTNVADGIRGLCHDAQVPEEKGNPRCLRRMYQETQKGILQNISALIDQAYEKLLETEQLAIGWAET